MDERTSSFGYWLRRRRKALDLTQEELARSVSCSRFAIRKIEADERRPSRSLAERLAEKLALPADERSVFVHAARALRSSERLQIDARPVVVADGGTEPAPFVGRSNEYGRLIGLLERLAAGTGYVAMIEGEPGIGKSRLMHEVARYARSRNVCALETRCYEIERGMAYQPVVDLVSQALQRAPSAALGKLARVSLAEIAALVPAAGERFGGLPALSADFPEARQARLFSAVVQLFDALVAGGPLLLLVDDIQWADDASLQFLHYLARQTANRPLLALYSYRDDELDTDARLAGLVQSVRREAHARHLPLARLSPEDAQTLIDTLPHPQLPAAGLAGRLHRETEGNPFFLLSMLHALAEGDSACVQAGELPFPDALREWVRTRLAHVPDEARSALDVAAVLGRRFDFDTLIAVMKKPEEQLLQCLEQLVKRRLLHEESDGGIYDFTHDKLREAVYRDLGGTRRVRLHGAVAEALEQMAGSHTNDRDARLAEHYERAHVWNKALHYLLLAAERSQKLFAMRDALHWLDRAVALAEAHHGAVDEQAALEMYARRGAARAQMGHTEGAVADIRRVMQAARNRGDRKEARDALIQLGMTYRRADDYAQATLCLEQALAESRAAREDRHAADTLYHLGTVAWSNGRNREAIEFHQQAVEICERMSLTDLVAVQAFHGRGEAYFANSEPLPAIDCYTRSLELARGIGDRSYESENLMMIAYACIGEMGLGDYARAAAQFEGSLEIAQAADLQWHLGPTLLGLDHVRACGGQYGEAWNGMRRTLSWLESVRQVRYQLMAHHFIGELLLDLGLNEQALEYLERGIALAQNRRIMFWRHRMLANRGIARLRLGRDDAGEALETALAQSRQDSERYLMARCLEALAELALAQGDTARCRTFADALLTLAGSNGLQELDAQARRWRGKAFLAAAQYQQAKQELSKAASLADRIGRVRLSYDIQRELACLCEKNREQHIAEQHRANAAALAARIAASLAGSGLEAALESQYAAR